MNAARKHYEEMAVMTDDQVRETLAGMRGAGLGGLYHYALGREDSPSRDRVLIFLLMQGGQRYLARQAAKKAKAAKKARRIL